MRVTLVKGKFTVSQDRKGAAHIMCNVCGDKDVLPKQGTMTDEEFEVALQKHFKTAMKSVPPDVGSLKTAKQWLETGKSGNLAKFFNENETASGDRSLANVTAELGKPSPNVLKPMLVAPMMLNGRPMGLQPVVCFYCGQVGLINCEAERPAPHGYKLAITSLNEDPRVHAVMRAKVSYTVLLCLDFMCGITLPDGVTKLIPPMSHIVCPGATIQAPGKKGGEMQDAHQVLREITINGYTIYDMAKDCPAVPVVMKNSLVYCNSAVTHMHKIYNAADNLIEHEIAADFVELAQQIVSRRIRQGTTHDEVFRRYLWRLLLIRYFYACRMALINAEGDKKLTDVIELYLVEVSAMKNSEPPAFVNDLDATGMCGEFSSFYKTL